MSVVEEARTLSGRYRLGARLGHGGMAEVYAAEDLRLGRPVAIKLLRRQLGEDPAVRARFEREACTAARIAHPNIVGILDIGEDDGVAFIIMERLDGSTLADELLLGRLAEGRVRQVAVQVLAALGAAHAAGIVHRDVKPANILTCRDGRVKVADFGIATALDEAQHITSTGWLVGTPAYVAPERILGKAATPSSDLYSLGAVLFECLSGERPFADKTTVELLAAIREEVPVPVSTLRPGVDPILCRLIDDCLRKDPAARPASARAMAQALATTYDVGTVELRLPPTEAFRTPTTVAVSDEEETAGRRPFSLGSGALRRTLARSVAALPSRFRVPAAFAGSVAVSLILALAVAGPASGSHLVPAAHHAAPPSLPGHAPGGGGTHSLGRALATLSQAVG